MFMKGKMKMSTIKEYFKVCLLTAFIAFLFATCRKDTLESETNIIQDTQQDNYTSMSDFYKKNAVGMQTFSVTAATGGTFATPQGTQVTIPGLAFMTLSHIPVDTGTVKIEFKDIYKRSDMLLSDMPTMTQSGPLKSGGEFFMRATINGVPLQLLPSASITIVQPFGTFARDSMTAFVERDSIGMKGWVAPPTDTIGNPVYSVVSNVSSYIFSFYQFASPEDSGTWCNSDNKNYFLTYPTTGLTLHETDNPDTFHTDVFLVFKNIDCMVHVYRGLGSDYPYLFAPQGLACTIVAVGEKGGALYASFTSDTIGSNQTVNFALSKTNTDAFKTSLKALDNQ